MCRCEGMQMCKLRNCDATEDVQMHGYADLQTELHPAFRYLTHGILKQAKDDMVMVGWGLSRFSFSFVPLWGVLST